MENDIENLNDIAFELSLTFLAINVNFKKILL